MKYTPFVSKILLTAVLLVSAILSYFLVTKTHFDYRLTSLFPKHDPQLAYFQAFQDSFSSNDEYLSIGLIAEEGIFKEDFLKDVHALTTQLEVLPHVLNVNSLTNQSWLKVYGMGYRKEVPLLHFQQPKRYARDSTFLFSLPPFRHTYYSDDATGTCIYLKITPHLAQTPAGDSLLAQLNAAVDSYDFDQVYLNGYLPGHTTSVKKIERELFRFTAMSSLLVLLFLFLTFRSGWGMLVPMVIIGLSGIWAAGLMAACGVAVNVMTVILPSIMFVVATSDVIHLLSKYLEERRKGQSSDAALHLTVREVGLATLLTSVTTAIGLLSLYISDILPLQQLGLFAGMGVMLAFLLTYMLLPSLIVLFPPPTKIIERNAQATWSPFLSQSWRFVHRNTPALSAIFVACFGLAILAGSWVRVHNYFGKDLKGSDPHAQSMAFFDQKMGGTRPFNLSIQILDSTRNFGETKLVRQLALLDSFLIADYGLSKSYSMISMLKGAHSALNRGKASHYAVPTSDSSLAYVQGMLLSFSDSASLRKVLADGNRLARITGAVPDWGSAEAQRRNATLDAFVREHIDSTILAVHVAGFAEMVDRSHRVVTFNMLQGLLMALGIVGLLMGLLFRSFKMIILSLIPNIFPLLMIFGLMGLVGITLNMASAVIFTIAFGIAVDDTIHFIARLRLELDKEKDLLTALEQTFRSTGRAIIITSLVIAAGFLILMTSDFTGTSKTGALVSATLILAVLADLVLLPILLMRFWR